MHLLIMLHVHILMRLFKHNLMNSIILSHIDPILSYKLLISPSLMYSYHNGQVVKLA